MSARLKPTIMKAPVVYLAFSNDRDDYLPTLNRERKAISRSLRPLEGSGAINLEVEASASLNDIFEVFREYDNRIAVFHFGGHAGGRQLQLEQADATTQGAQARGLAQLLGQQENLRLVVLNGCATHEQVRLLLDAGVRAVIATISAIQDAMATEFAEQFYYYLAIHYSLQHAFDMARAFLDSKYEEHPSISTFRGAAFETAEENPWGLYINEGAEEVLDWSLPRHVAPEFPPFGPDIQPGTRVNDILISAICLELVQYSRDLNYELSKEKEERSESSIKRAVVDAFPTPIGEDLRKLVCKSGPAEGPHPLELFSRERLLQLVQAYRTSVQFLFFMLLSQLWDEKYKNPKLKIGEDYLGELNSFLTLRASSFPSFDYVRLIRPLLAFFSEHDIPCFIPELEQAQWEGPEDGEVFRAVSFMDKLNLALLSGAVKEENVKNLCLQAETHLGAFLKNFAFLAKYKLAAIKNIEVIKNRHESPQYRHNQIALDKALTVATVGAHPRDIVLSNFTDNKCVLLMKTAGGEVKDYLSLAPFLMDKNSLVNEKSAKLYLYSYQQDGAYVFHFLNDRRDPPMAIDEQAFQEVFAQFEKFRAEIFGFQPRMNPSVPAPA